MTRQAMRVLTQKPDAGLVFGRGTAATCLEIIPALAAQNYSIRNIARFDLFFDPLVSTTGQMPASPFYTMTASLCTKLCARR
jgi:hypothetical protein